MIYNQFLQLESFLFHCDQIHWPSVSSNQSFLLQHPLCNSRGTEPIIIRKATKRISVAPNEDVREDTAEAAKTAANSISSLQKDHEDCESSNENQTKAYDKIQKSEDGDDK